MKKLVMLCAAAVATAAWANTECSYANGEWSPNAPTSADSVKMVSGNLEWKSPLPMTVKGWSQPDTYTGTVTFNTGLDTFTVDGDVDLQGGVWTHTANPSMKSTDAGWINGRGTKQLIVAVTGKMTVGAKAAVHADERGFIKAQGPGYGVSGYSQGASHGSSGDGNANKVYGSLFEPVTIGSGSAKSPGGGAVHLAVTNALTINGRVSANATPYTDWGCAAGGSVYISAGSLSGSGSIEANAEAYTGSRTGGGGRIAVYLTGTGSDFTSFTGTMIAYGSRTYNASTSTFGSSGNTPPGPIYLEKKADGHHRGELRLENGPANPSRYYYVPLPMDEGPYHFSKISIGGCSQLGIRTGQEVTADAIVGSTATRSLILLSGGTLIAPRPFDVQNFSLFVGGGTDSQVKFASGSGAATMTLVSGSTLTCDNPLTIDGNLILRSGATVKHNSNYDLAKSGDAMVKLNLTVAGDLTVDSGATITAKSAGCDYKYTFGKGAPDTTGISYGRSASHGGLAKEATDDKVYGSIREPVDFGSGGYLVSNPNSTSSGGGVIKLTVGGATTMNGIITADAKFTRNVKISGSGGSVWLTTGSLVGAGSISADGGMVAKESTNAGAGGRVAITLTDADADFDGFTGSITATGGHATNDDAKNYAKVVGPAGTIYLRTGAQGPELGTLVITNGLIALSTVTSKTVIGPKCTDTRVGSVQVGANGRLHLAAGATLGAAKDVAYVSDGTFTVDDSPDAGLTPGGTLSFFDATCVGRLLGAYSLANLSVAEPGKEIQFDATAEDGVTIRSGGSFTMTGDAGNLVKLRSTVDGTQAKLTIEQGVTPSVSFADVKDSNAVGLSIAAKDSVDSGNNSANWILTTIVAGEELLWTGEAGNGDWGDLGNWHRGRPPEPTDFIRIGCTNLVVTHWPSLPSDMSIGKLEIGPGGQLALAGRSLTVTNGCSVAGTIVANGGELLALAGNISLSTISGGTVDLELCGSGDQTVTLGNNVFGTVQFDKDSGTVSFADGVSCRKFLHSGTMPLTFAFAAGTTLAADELRLACADGETARLTLRSQTAAQPWKVNVRNLALVRGVIVSDSHATGKDLYADAPSTNSGGNSKWHFGSRSVTWIGGASGVFTNAANWSDGKAPDGDTRIILENSVTLTIPKDATGLAREILASGGTTTISGAGTLHVVSMFVIEDGATVVLDVPTTVDDYAEVMSGGTLTYTGSSSPTVTNRLFMTVGGNFTVGAGGKVTGYNCGLPYDSKWTDLPGWSQDSGSHGGIGSGGVSCYGSVFEPVGHGVGPRSTVNSRGGGVIRLIVAGTLTVDGTVDGDAGAGSYYTAPGGSVWITCGSLAGSGTISANGGRCTSNDYSRSGGGGRVAVYQTVAGDFSGFGGEIIAHGGRFANAAPYSGCGTVYLESANDGVRGGTIVLDNALGNAKGAQLPAKYDGDDPRDFRNVKLVMRNNGSFLLSQDLKVRDLDVTAGTAYMTTNSYSLTVSENTHYKGRNCWNGTMMGLRVLSDGKYETFGLSTLLREKKLIWYRGFQVIVR